MALETSALESLLADVMDEAERMERLRYRPNTGPAPRQWSGQMQLVLSMARQDGNALNFLKALFNMLKSGQYEADDIWQFRCLMHERPTAARIPRDEIHEALQRSKDRWDWSSEGQSLGKTALADLRLYRALKYDTLETLLFDALLTGTMPPAHVALIAAALREAPDEDWLRDLLHEKLGDIQLGKNKDGGDHPASYQEALRASFHESVTHRPLAMLTDTVLEFGEPTMAKRLIQALRTNPATDLSVNCLTRLLKAGHLDAKAALLSIGILSKGKVPTNVTGRALSAGLSASS